jgi:ParB/RepB/Spo0J family partition protein
MAETTFLPVAHIRPYKTNVRSNTDITELTASIKEHGILTPVLVRALPHPNGFTHELIAGFRRFAAAKKLDLQVIPALVISLVDDDINDVQLVENLQRQDLDALDTADVIAAFAKKGRTIEEIAKTLGKTLLFVSQYRRLSEMNVRFKTELKKGTLPVHNALEIARMTPEDQRRLFEHPNYWWKSSLSELRQFIDKEFRLDMRKASFDTKKDELIPGVVSCTHCMKRTGAGDSLFNDIKKLDRCTDSACWNKKTIAFVKAQIAVAKTQAGDQPVVLVTNDYSPLDDGTKIYGDVVIGTQSYRIARCANSKLAVVVKQSSWSNGAKVGSIVRICMEGSSCKECYPRSVASASASSKKEKAFRQERIQRQAVAKAALTVEVSPKKLIEEYGDPYPLILNAYIDRMGFDDLRRTVQALGISLTGRDDVRLFCEKTIKSHAKSEPVKLGIFLVKALPVLGLNQFNETSAKELETFAKTLGVDVKEVRTTATAPKPKKEKKKSKT